jgi:hypothetical protein
MIEMSRKAGFFSLIRIEAAIAKNAKTQLPHSRASVVWPGAGR